MNTDKNKLGNYWFSPQKNILYWKWLPKTADATWDMMREALLEYVEFAKKCQTYRYIIDERDQYFIFVPAYQDWMDTHITAQVWLAGCRYFALIKSKDIFVEVAGQQVFTEINASKITMQMFDNIEDAEQWVCSFSE